MKSKDPLDENLPSQYPNWASDERTADEAVELWLMNRGERLAEEKSDYC